MTTETPIAPKPSAAKKTTQKTSKSTKPARSNASAIADALPTNFHRPRRKYKLADDLVPTDKQYIGVRMYKGIRYVADIVVQANGKRHTFFLTSCKDARIAASVYDAFVLAVWDEVENGALNFPHAKERPALSDALKAKAAEAKKLIAPK